MEDISQTKEGFIKSMVLFVLLLVICFTPFLAFSESAFDKPLHEAPNIQKTAEVVVP